MPGGAKLCEELRPAQSSRGFPRQAMNSLNALSEPSFQFTPPRTGRHQMNTKTNLAQNNRVNGDLTLVSPKPLNHPRLRLRLGRLAQDIGIDKVGHRVSV